MLQREHYDYVAKAPIPPDNKKYLTTAPTSATNQVLVEIYF